MQELLFFLVVLMPFFEPNQGMLLRFLFYLLDQQSQEPQMASFRWSYFLGRVFSRRWALLSGKQWDFLARSGCRSSLRCWWEPMWFSECFLIGSLNYQITIKSLIGLYCSSRNQGRKDVGYYIEWGCVIAWINNFIACRGIYPSMSSIDKLVELLRKRNSQPRPEERPAKARNYLTQEEIISIRRKAAREFKLPWKGSSIEARTTKYKPIRGKCLSNWQIDRILLSDRSFSKNLMAVKVQAANQSFYKITAKDKEGHLPLVQTSLLPKLQSIQAKIRMQDFVPAKGVTTSFGMEKIKYYSPKAIERRQSSFN